MSSAIQHGSIDSTGNRLAAIVLAAGYSSRMVEFKPLLPLGGSTAFEQCLHIFRSAGIDAVIAVLGHRAVELRPLAKQSGARCVLNPQFDQGMYSSIVIGSRALPRWAEAAFVLPSDIPLVRAGTVRRLVEAWAARRAGIVYPIFNGHRGHPPLIGRQILDQVAKDGAEGPLSALLATYESDAIEVPVADEAIHLDMDTQADYKALAALSARRDIPTSAECEAILVEQHVDARIVRHSRKVAEVAVRITLALVNCGVDLSPELVRSGSLLHDVAKGQPNHATAAASILRRMGFDPVAKIVSAHTDLGSSLRLNEKAIVYLADKLVRGDELVTLKERFKPAFTRFSKNPAALQAARARMQKAKKVARMVELRVGASVETIANGEFDSNNRIAGPRHKVGTR